MFFRLLVGTIYVKRRGWVYFEGEDKGWGKFDVNHIKAQDPAFAEKITTWGDGQILPEWKRPNGSLHKGILVDLECRVTLQVEVLDKPNQLVAMAMHGNGMTAMLINRENGLLKVASKVGIANLPPYILAQSLHSGSVYVGGTAPKSSSTTSHEPTSSIDLKDDLEMGTMPSLTINSTR
ncbi:hypothetical protein M422DRAFT_178836 [Sphaerobolus stellatus SS14]|uniref:Uncharacterized protein n=1 Tax=Sphaerobolus stellatus (strain SS14) TaxID=990650 RepID=A0A0C9V5N4_SPHS4|nr:hypothetical protein M422DRAFT_178836 [Sphaerobolus stellatus SS14]